MDIRKGKIKDPVKTLNAPEKVSETVIPSQMPFSTLNHLSSAKDVIDKTESTFDNGFKKKTK